MKKYLEKMKKYEGNMTKYEGKMKKYEGIRSPRYGPWDLKNSPGVGERHANAVRIPEMASST